MMFRKAVAFVPRVECDQHPLVLLHDFIVHQPDREGFVGLAAQEVQNLAADRLEIVAGGGGVASAETQRAVANRNGGTDAAGAVYRDGDQVVFVGIVFRLAKFDRALGHVVLQNRSDGLVDRAQRQTRGDILAAEGESAVGKNHVREELLVALD